MKCIKNTDAREFASVNEVTLLKKESENNLILGLTNSLVDQPKNEDSPDFFTICDHSGEDFGEVYGQCLRSSPDRPLAISNMSEQALYLVINQLNF